MTLTHHGHHIPGTTHDNEPVDMPVTECAGPYECQPCTRDSEKAWYPEMSERQKDNKVIDRDDVQMGKLDIRGMIKKKRSNVVHPSHYNMYDGIEVIDLVEQMNYNKGNAVKYITRSEFKGKEIEDLQKARYSLKKEIKRLKRNAKKKSNKWRGGSIVGPVFTDEIHGLGGPGSGETSLAAANAEAHRMVNPSIMNVRNNG